MNTSQHFIQWCVRCHQCCHPYICAIYALILSISALFWRGCMSVCNVIVVCLFELGVSETWNSKSCKCDCEGAESPTEFPSIRTGSSMVRGVDCMPGMMTSVSWRSSRSAICFLLFLVFLRTEARIKVSARPQSGETAVSLLSSLCLSNIILKLFQGPLLMHIW